VAKLSRIGLLSAVVLAMAAGEGRANPWLERTHAIEQPWELPFVAQPRRAQPTPAQQKQKRSRVPEAQAEQPRELHRMPEPHATSEYAPAAANVFPPPRPPMVAPPPAAEPEPAVTAQKRTPQPVAARDRNRQAQPVRDPVQERAQKQPVTAGNRSQQAAPVPARERNPQQITPTPVRTQKTAVVREADRNAERNLERQLKRELPRIQAPVTGVPAVPEQFACGERLARIARYTPLPARSGPTGCGASDLVKLESVLMADKSVVTISPSPQIRCSMAEQLAEWVRDDIGPTAVAELGSPLASIAGNDAYECRPRNNVKGAKISEHGRGNAFDLATFRLKNGGVFNFTDPLVHKPFRDRVRAAACGRFMTVLGPGSDGYHSGHIHLDLAERSRNAKVCQWDVRDVTVAARTDGGPANGQTNARLLAAAPKAALEPAPIPPADPASAAATSEKTAAMAPAELPFETSPEMLPDTPAENTPAAAPSATREEEAVVAVPAAPVANQEERPAADAASPPLPMRKPEALRARQALAQTEQSRPRSERRGSHRYYYRHLDIFRHLLR
jgi:hypothetical protein